MSEDDYWDDNTPVGDVPEPPSTPEPSRIVGAVIHVPRGTPRKQTNPFQKVATPPPTVPNQHPIVPGPTEYGDHPGQRASARRALAEITEVKKLFNQHSKDDLAALENIRAKLDTHGDKIDAFSETLTAAQTTMTELRVAAATQTSAVSTLSDELRHRREMEKLDQAARTRATADQLGNEREKMSNRTKVLLALVGVVGTFVGAYVKYKLSGG